MKESEQSEFERQAREAFDREVAGLDAATRSKLNRARQRALSEVERPGTSWLGVPLPYAAAAAVAVAAIGALLLMRGGISPDDAPQDLVAASDIEVLLAEDEMAFLEEIEFYAWLEAQPEFENLQDTPEAGAG